MQYFQGLDDVGGDRGRNGRHVRGIALVIVLWVLVLLGTLALSLATLTRTEGLAVFAFKNDLENKYLSEAGVQRGLTEILYRLANKNQTTILEGREVCQTDGKAYYGKLGAGSYAFRISDESGKINLNRLNETNSIVFFNLLRRLGVEEKDANTIIDSLLDWKDADELHRLHGAESDYYMTLPNPYKAKNAPFDAVEELALVKGVTPLILYGNSEKPGIAPFITVYANIDKINVNAAAPEVLLSLPGMTENAATNLTTLRDAKAAKATDAQEIMGVNYSLAAPYISCEDSRYFTIETVGFRESEKRGYPIKTVVAVESAKAMRTLYYKSPAHERNE